MKRELTARQRQRVALPPGPLFRDVAPDRVPVALYDEDGEVMILRDLPASLMDSVRKHARAIKASPAAVLCQFVRDAIERGF